MAAVHNATMTYAKRLNIADTFMESAAAEQTFNKLARTFTTQVAALKQYRTSGQQKMTVEHVHVHDGGHRNGRPSLWAVVRGARSGIRWRGSCGSELGGRECARYHASQ